MLSVCLISSVLCACYFILCLYVCFHFSFCYIARACVYVCTPVSEWAFLFLHLCRVHACVYLNLSFVYVFSFCMCVSVCFFSSVLCVWCTCVSAPGVCCSISLCIYLVTVKVIKKKKNSGFVFINSLPLLLRIERKPLFHSTAFLQIVSARKTGQD